MTKSALTPIDDGGRYVTVTPQDEQAARLLNRQLDRIQSFMPSQRHRVTPTKLAKRLVMEKAREDTK
ncbi:hypothetical protein KSI86_14690 [Dickeya oryzae]|uniref:hypothetical protein n=1 Tax=Dickeya oryzae TaxID=1240404 RepID=UPI002098548A|nr:hypothetical protein [Dickeya oryzae]MCO7255407.1 hypothetical protein [Dickeya oryzae]